MRGEEQERSTLQFNEHRRKRKEVVKSGVKVAENEEKRWEIVVDSCEASELSLDGGDRCGTMRIDDDC